MRRMAPVMRLYFSKGKGYQMKKTMTMKKLVCLLLALVMVFSLTVPALAATRTFRDVDSGQWYFKAVEYCADNGYMNGVGDGVFSPGGVVSRAMVAQVLFNMTDAPYYVLAENPFTDVANNMWFAKAVVWGRQNGVISGTSDTTFAPNDQVTREQVCTLFYRYYKDFLRFRNITLKSEAEMAATFTDWSDVSGYAREAVRWSNDVGFISGTSATTLSPKAGATRAQLAQFLMNFDKVLGADLSDYSPTPVTPTPTPTPEEPKPEEPKPSDPNTLDPITDVSKVNSFEIDPEYGNDHYANAVYKGQADDYSSEPAVKFVLQNLATPHSHPNYVPNGGFVVGGTTSTFIPVEGSHYSWTKASPGSTIYNRYGIDVTDVDAYPSSVELEIIRAINAYQVKESASYITSGAKTADDLRFYVDYYAQQTAETIVKEGYLNFSNYAKAGLPLDDYDKINRVIQARPDLSQKLVDLSATCSTKTELWNAFDSYLENYDPSNSFYSMFYSKHQGQNWKVYTEWEPMYDGVQQSDLVGLTYVSTVVHFDHTPSIGEIAYRLYWRGALDLSQFKDRPAIGVSFDAATNTVVVVALDSRNRAYSGFVKAD